MEMKRLTEKREDEIREFLKYAHDRFLIEELLDEIDALRCEKADLFAELTRAKAKHNPS